MKKNYVFSLAILFAMPCFCQIEWVSDLQYNYEIKTFKRTKQRQHVLNLEQASFNAPVVVAIDGQDSEIFHLSESPHEDGTLITISDIIELGDSSIIIPIHNLMVDPYSGMGTITEEVVKFDINWESTGWGGYPMFTEDAFGHGLSDNGFVLYDADSPEVARQGSDCQNIWYNFFGFQVLDLAVTSDDHLVWAGSDGLAVMDVDGIIDSVYTGLLFEKVQNTSWDGIVGLKQDSLFLLSNEFDLLAGFGLPNDDILDFKVGFGQIAVLTKEGSVYLFSDSLVLQNSFPLVDESEFQFIDVGSDRLALAGVETYGSAMPTGGTKAIFTKDYAFDGDNFDLSHDIGVVGIVPGNASVTSFPTEYEVIYDSLFITVHNHGNKPVNDFYIRHFSSDPNQQQTKKFENILLEPGESTVVVWESFSVHTEVMPSGFMGICLWTSHPGRKLDSDSTNDGLCVDFLVYGNETLTDFGFKIYPNPSTSGSTIIYDIPLDYGGNAHARIFDGMGRLIDRFDIVNDNGSILLPAYPDGLYYISLIVGEQVLETLKFVQL